MKTGLRKGVLITGAVCVGTLLAVAVGTPLPGNALMLLMERSNRIPEESSIFTFEPTVISQGSANYWLYGSDGRHHFHFTHTDTAPYVYVPVGNRCPGFDPHQVRTWCDVRTGGRP